MTRLAASIVCALLCAAPAWAQAPADGVEALLKRLEAAVDAQDRAAVAALFQPEARPTDVDRFTGDLLMPAALRATLRERDRAPLEGVPAGQGFRSVIEVFEQSAGRARILTTSIEYVRPPDGDAASWRISATESLSSIEGLFRLRLNVTTPSAARDLEITSEDLSIVLAEGTVFPVDSDDGVTGLVLVGRGEMRFAPTPQSERGQLRIFSGSEALTVPFETAFVRLSPSDYRRRVSVDRLSAIVPDARDVRRAQEVFGRESPKSFSLDLQDLSRETWHLLPATGDFIAEVQTRRFGTLTYTRSSQQAEDVSLFQRDRRRTIALYPSAAKLAARGRFYSDDASREFDVLDYNIDASIVPDRESIQARARLSIRVRSTALSSLTIRLAEPLAVSSVTSVELGRLLFLRVRNQNALVVNLPRTLQQDDDLTLIITYGGRLEPQPVDSETVAVAQDGPIGPAEFMTANEPHFLLSNRTFWYPQSPVADYATATIRIVVPDGYRCIASGEPQPEANAAVSVRDIIEVPDGRPFHFRAAQPLRYLAVVVSRLTRVYEGTVTIEDPRLQQVQADRVAVAVEASPRNQGRGRAMARPIEDIIRFYATTLGDAPFASDTIALVDGDLPGGHSPGYFAVINLPPQNAPMTWRNDPAAFDGFPEFFLAHELAHQWWGQAIGWKNYHEQWLSEGFAQYFAALYAHKARGDRVFTDMLRQFRRWTLAESDQGPVHLGYRLGHIKGDYRVFRALVYNKGAAALHMLRRLLGDELFFEGLRRFYEDRKFQKAGTDDLQRALEGVAGRRLDRFFEHWIYGTAIPKIGYASAIRDNAVVVRFRQEGDLVFELPVTVTLVYADGRSSDVTVAIAEKDVERTIPTSGPVRQVHVNRDNVTPADFDQASLF